MSQGFIVGLPQRLFTATGAPADGWKIATKVAGLSTDLTTYSDATLLSANTNPIITDSTGYFRCFVAETVLIKLVVSDDNDVEQFTLDNLEPMPDTTGSSGTATAVQVGSFVPYGAASAPTGFLLCDGSAVSRATYSGLFAVIGTTYGPGDGSTTFNVPDCRGRFVLGVAASGTGNALGATGGAIDHTHTGPSHTHTIDIPIDGWGSILNNPSITGNLNVGDASGTGVFASAFQATASPTVTTSASGTGNTGTANPPFITANWIIKT